MSDMRHGSPRTGRREWCIYWCLCLQSLAPPTWSCVIRPKGESDGTVETTPTTAPQAKLKAPQLTIVHFVLQVRPPTSHTPPSVLLVGGSTPLWRWPTRNTHPRVLLRCRFSRTSQLARVSSGERVGVWTTCVCHEHTFPCERSAQQVDAVGVVGGWGVGASYCFVLAGYCFQVLLCVSPLASGVCWSHPRTISTTLCMNDSTHSSRLLPLWLRSSACDPGSMTSICCAARSVLSPVSFAISHSRLLCHRPPSFRATLCTCRALLGTTTYF